MKLILDDGSELDGKIIYYGIILWFLAGMMVMLFIQFVFSKFIN